MAEESKKEEEDKKIERHRASTIDLLPAEAEPDIVWALAEIAEGKRHQKDIWKEFNSRLADRGIGGVSHSAFGRYALRKRRMLLRLKETREIAAAFVSAQDATADDDITSAVAGTIKNIILEMTENDGIADSKSAMEAARALQALVAAQRISTDRRKKLEAEIDTKVGAAVDKVAQAAGLSADRAAEIRRQVLGLRT